MWSCDINFHPHRPRFAARAQWIFSESTILEYEKSQKNSHLFNSHWIDLSIRVCDVADRVSSPGEGYVCPSVSCRVTVGVNRMLWNPLNIPDVQPRRVQAWHQWYAHIAHHCVKLRDALIYLTSFFKIIYYFRPGKHRIPAVERVDWENKDCSVVPVQWTAPRVLPKARWAVSPRSTLSWSTVGPAPTTLAQRWTSTGPRLVLSATFVSWHTPSISTPRSAVKARHECNDDGGSLIVRCVWHSQPLWPVIFIHDKPGIPVPLKYFTYQKGVEIHSDYLQDKLKTN